MTGGVFNEIEHRLRDGEDIEDILDDIAQDLDDEELRTEVEEEFKSFFEGVIENPNNIFEFESEVENLLDKGFQHLGSSIEEFREYLRNSVEENEELADTLETHLMSWHNILTWIQILEKRPEGEFSDSISNLFSEAVRQDAARVNQILSGPFEGTKFVQGYQKSLSRTSTEGKPTKKVLTDKIEIIEDFFESVYLPIARIIAQFISIILEYSTDLNRGDIRERIEASETLDSRFWDEEARHIRNSSAHTEYKLLGNSVLIIDQEWRREFSDEELDHKITQLVDKTKNALYALSDVYFQEFPHERFYLGGKLHESKSDNVG